MRGSLSSPTVKREKGGEWPLLASLSPHMCTTYGTPLYAHPRYTHREAYMGGIHSYIHTQGGIYERYTPIYTPQGGIYERFTLLYTPQGGIYERVTPYYTPQGGTYERFTPYIHPREAYMRGLPCIYPREAHMRGLHPVYASHHPFHCWARLKRLSLLTRFTVGLGRRALSLTRFTVGLGGGGCLVYNTRYPGGYTLPGIYTTSHLPGTPSLPPTRLIPQHR